MAPAKTTSLEAIGLDNAPVMLRFWDKVNKDGVQKSHMDTPCWEWTGCRNTQSRYGMIRFKRYLVRVHRLSWMWANRIAPTLDILHHCDTRHCVRPDHLYEGTNADNIRDMMSRFPNWHADWGRPVKQYALDGTFIKEWKSSRAAERALGLQGSLIRECVRPNGRQKTHGGFKWTKGVPA